METTTTINFTNKVSWAGIQHEHDPKLNHQKNKYLNTPESKRLRKFNKQEKLLDYDKLTNDLCGKYVKEHDRKCLKRGQKVRCYGNVKSYLRHFKNKEPYYMAVHTFSEKDVWDKWKNDSIKKLMQARGLTHDQAESKVFLTVQKGFANYCHDYNKRNPNLRLTDYRLDMDEKGAPHYHGRYLAMSHTKKGKPRLTLDGALRTQMGLDGSKVASRDILSKYVSLEDKALFSSINGQIERNLPECENFTFIRKKQHDKNLVTGVKHDEFVKNKQVLQNQRITQDLNKIQIDQTREQYNSVNDEFNQLEPRYTEKKQKLTNSIDKEKDKLQKIKDEEAQEVKEREANIQRQIELYINDQNKQREKDLDAWQTKLYKKEQYNAQLEELKKIQTDAYINGAPIIKPANNNFGIKVIGYHDSFKKQQKDLVVSQNEVVRQKKQIIKQKKHINKFTHTVRTIGLTFVTNFCVGGIIADYNNKISSDELKKVQKDYSKTAKTALKSNGLIDMFVGELHKNLHHWGRMGKALSLGFKSIKSLISPKLSNSFNDLNKDLEDIQPAYNADKKAEQQAKQVQSTQPVQSTVPKRKGQGQGQGQGAVLGSPIDISDDDGPLD